MVPALYLAYTSHLGAMVPVSYPVSRKLIVSGEFVEYFHYEKPYWRGTPPYPARTIKKDSPSSEQKSIREDNAKRAGSAIRRLVNSNPQLKKFMTLTYGSPVLDLEVSNKHFNNFIHRLRRLKNKDGKLMFPNFQYLAVPEFQKNSRRVHYHLLCNLPFVDENYITQIWGHGFAFLRNVYHVTNLGAYISKYLTKESFDTRYFRKRKYFYSYDLLRPLVVDKLRQVYTILKNIPIVMPQYAEKIYEKEFCTKYLGVVRYKQYRVLKHMQLLLSGFPTA